MMNTVFLALASIFFYPNSICALTYKVGMEDSVLTQLDDAFYSCKGISAQLVSSYFDERGQAFNFATSTQEDQWHPFGSLVIATGLLGQSPG